MTRIHHDTTKARWILARTLPLIIGAAMPACQSEPFPTVGQAWIYGHITDVSGLAIVGANVLVEVYDARNASRVGQEPSATDSDGRYALRIAVFRDPPFDALVTVSATASGPNALQARREDLAVTFREPPARLDSVSVDLVLLPVGAAR